MNRGMFGSWGLELPSEDFARVVAGLGTDIWPSFRGIEEFAERLRELAARDDDAIVEWHRYRVDERFWRPFPPFDPVDAKALAGAWTTFSGGIRNLHLELQYVPPPEQADAVRVLAAPEVNADGVYLREDMPEGEVRWNWPLRVGFVDNPESRSLFRALAKLLKSGRGGWRKQYVQLIPPGELDALGCHLLLLPGGLRNAVASLAATRQVVRTACAVILGEAGDATATAALMDTVRSLCRAEGLAVVDVPRAALSTYDRYFDASKDRTPQNLWAAWFIELVRALSHDRPLDAALFDIWRELGRPGMPPLIVASRRLILESRIRSRLARLSVQLQEPAFKDRRLVLPKRRDLGGQFLGPAEAQRMRLGELGEGLAAFSHRLRFDHESDAGSEMLDLLDVYRQVCGEQPARPPRWVQAYVLDPSTKPGRSREDGEPVREIARNFRPGVVHAVEVFVGPREEGAISPPPGAPPLPEDSLPEDRGVMLTVVLAEAAEGRAPQVRRVFLPRTGRSSTCRFAVRVAEDTKRFEARIIVLFRNRVLQTSLLTGPVAGRSGDEDGAIRITPEAVLRDNLDDLEARSDFDATIVLNHAGDGTPALTAVHDGVAVRIPLPDGIKEAAKWFDDRMEEVADYASDFGSLTSEANLDLLRRMAQQGSMLWRTFDYEISADIDMSRYERLQVVSIGASTRLPVEFFYDRPAPRDDATLCPGAIEALETGKPCKTCAKRDPQDDSVVCPLGFWGLTRVLERHMHAKGERENRNELRPAGPIGNRKVLSILGTYLFAGSNRVDAVQPNGLARVKDALEKACGSPPLPIATWEEWAERVGQHGAQLLFIVPHVVEGHQPEMEIGVASRLQAALITARHVRDPKDREPAPVVVLLGCKTGKAKVPFSELPSAFRMLGAAIVLCTGAPIVGRHAVPVAEALLKGLRAAAAARKPKSLGDVIRDLRRTMVLDGLPMILTLLAFGDFDWQIAAGPSVAPAASAAAATRAVAAEDGGALVKT